MRYTPKRYERAALDKKDPNDLFAVAKSVAEFLFMCRINPWWNLAGVQSWDEDEYKYQVQRVNLINRMLSAKPKYWLEDD